METTDTISHYRPNSLEKWLFRGLLTVLIALVGFIGNRAINSQDATTKSVNDLTDKVAVLSTQFSYLSSQISQYTTTPQQLALMQQVQTDHEKRLERLESILYGKRNGLH